MSSPRYHAMTRRVDMLEAEVAEYDALTVRLSNVLTRTADALKCSAPDLVWHPRHDWSDLPQVAQRLMRQLAAVSDRVPDPVS